MSDNKKDAGRQGRKSRNRRSGGGLRKHQTVESVVVEESFGLFSGQNININNNDDGNNNSNNNDDNDNNHNKAGDGVYVSATSHNKRYYGVLIDQAALKQASGLWFQDEASSLELNRRMKHLEQKSNTAAANVANGNCNSNANANDNQKPAAIDTTTTTTKEPPPSTTTTSATDEPSKEEETEKADNAETSKKTDTVVGGTDGKTTTTSNSSSEADTTTTKISGNTEPNIIIGTTTTSNNNNNNEKTVGDEPAAKTNGNGSSQAQATADLLMSLASGAAETTTTTTQEGSISNPDLKRPPGDSVEGCSESKRQKVEDESSTPAPITAATPDAIGSVPAAPLPLIKSNSKPPADPAATTTTTVVDLVSQERPVQKFKFVRLPQTATTDEDPGYRVLIATYCSIDAATEENSDKSRAIQEACDKGGDWCGHYYYQYDLESNTLTCRHGTKPTVERGMRTSMGLHTFLHHTVLPHWFPLSNLQMGQHKVLSMLHMKRDNNGNVIWDKDAAAAAETSLLTSGTHLPMQTRPKRFQIGVLGGGIAGLACCLELIKQLEYDNIDAQVVLLEARSRLGGRLWTDKETFGEDGDKFPVDLGASWIHGIDHNPLAALAKEANIEFVTTSENVQMLDKDMTPVNSKMDERMGKLFDDLLDLAAEDCWAAPDSVKPEGPSNPQSAIRWYSSVFMNDEKRKRENGDRKESSLLEATGAPAHRQSTDRSIDFEVGKAIAKHKLREFSKLSTKEHRMLLWNTKNVEYALGANIVDLSMKYWDADERHAFEGDHVLLKQGYSAVVDYMLESLKNFGPDRFKCVLDFPAGKVEYARKSATQPLGGNKLGRERKLVELSDSCCVSSQDGTQTKHFDFLVCAMPLGVLKESVARAGEPEANDKVSFQPCLPFSKIDSITNVGFGLLDKVYVQFPTAFWRKSKDFDEEDQTLFGNASGLNPHHYMFFDVGKSLGTAERAPPILMSLISGKEAVACENLSDKELVEEVMDTLRLIFSTMVLPEPSAFKITRWGQDQYSRGSYTFLPPGASDQDFQLLQSPINGNGDSLLLEASETMRLFFAGEHTTALHPSMAHGAMLSGIRAAKEVLATMKCSNDDEKDVDRLIPLSLFRHKNPETPLQCSLCSKVGGQVREGSLLSFKRGARQALVHDNCAEYSPEVEVFDGKWKNVIKAVNRGKFLNCSLCKKGGATIGCSFENCFRVFHFSCSEDSGWRFDRDGKIFFCDLHRKPDTSKSNNECDRISISYYLTKNPVTFLKCSLCQLPASDSSLGKLLAFQSGRRQVCIHAYCAKYTNVVDTTEAEESHTGDEHRNIFQAIDRSQACIKCSGPGATVACIDPSCNQCFHIPCARRSGWNFEKRGPDFRCDTHRNRKQSEPQTDSAGPVKNDTDATTNDNPGVESFQHNLLAQFGATAVGGAPRAGPRLGVPSNLDMGGTTKPTLSASKTEIESEHSDSDESFPGEDDVGEVMDTPLSGYIGWSKRDIKVARSSHDQPWNLSLKVVRLDDSGTSVLAAASSGKDGDSLQAGDFVVSINGTKIGSHDLKTLRMVLSRLKQEVKLIVQVVRKK